MNGPCLLKAYVVVIAQGKCSAPVTTQFSCGCLQELVAAGQPFVTCDYMLPTPDWAVYGADEAGFDPKETRFKKIRNHPEKLLQAAAVQI